ncbi:hypothetical protein CANARDRAFT_6510 [[Candida] arabinofermentans NRRL YB-2248]|uniref:DNA repair and recombination protein RAD54 n=1 Tax=[Candida] arabinofermentans NRRL YB-2248 TaxID=983967 RepID=A0A1E4T5B4_9ASCO|nr:hypothetical protein CANARDRAFT_6510 [[Candida] arabinofermentans NRRL YB-2248]
MSYRRAKKSKEPVNELGIGAGINPSRKRIRAFTDPTEKLLKPFKSPLVQTRAATAVLGDLTNTRAARRNGPKSYAEMDLGVMATDDKEDFMVDGEGNQIQHKKKGALLPRNFMNSADSSQRTLTRKFVVPQRSKPGNESELPNFQPPPPLGNKKKIFFPPRPLHDPVSEYAIVLYDPTVDVIPELQEEVVNAKLIEEKEQAEAEAEPRPTKRFKSAHKSLNEILGISNESEEQLAKKFPNVPVVIDPKLAKILRPHQIQGVKFLYRCTSGLVDASAKGCIMADEMGLGKTLQCLALMWTLLKQGPRGKKTIEKCIVVCPSSLVNNWANEIDKWLGKGALNSLAIDGKSTKSGELADALRNWARAKGRAVVRPVLIISYETLRRNVENLEGSEIGLILADEGHRLKNGDSLTFTALNALNCQRRVILSGTPIQNDLSEYFSLLNFSNPGLLGSRAEFRKNYELRILKGRDSLADDKERAAGDSKLSELTEIVSRFIIRRTNDILSKYLPVKYEYVIFCNMSPFQKKLYTHFITSPEISKLMRGLHSQPLKAIGLLKKLCNHPNLLNLPDDIQDSEKLIPEDYDHGLGNGRNREIQTWHSGKFEMLERFLFKISRETDDKIVVISNYTQTLDLVEKMCRQHRFGSLRLDGTMNINKRQKLVDKFNDPEGKEIVFLLSSKAGGCGINLIGANRLVLLDPDWNPASDQQALARVWRDGQKKNCFIYRFIATGTIEEKIFQRQSAKMQLSSCVVDSNEDVERLFSSDNLKQLFKFADNTMSETHDTYNCKKCDASTGKQKVKSPAMLYGDATTWNHINRDDLSKNEDFLIQNESQYDTISYAFQYISH